MWSLPFTLEACTDDHGNTGFVAAGAEGGLVPPGVVVTDWNDVPMEEAVDIRAERMTVRYVDPLVSAIARAGRRATPAAGNSNANVIRLRFFNERDVDRVVERFSSSTGGVILDLRGNPGGEVARAERLLDRLAREPLRAPAAV